MQSKLCLFKMCGLSRILTNETTLVVNGRQAKHTRGVSYLLSLSSPQSSACQRPQPPNTHLAATHPHKGLRGNHSFVFLCASRRGVTCDMQAPRLHDTRPAPTTPRTLWNLLDRCISEWFAGEVGVFARLCWMYSLYPFIEKPKLIDPCYLEESQSYLTRWRIIEGSVRRGEREFSNDILDQNLKSLCRSS